MSTDSKVYGRYGNHTEISGINRLNKLPEELLSLILYAEDLGNVSEVCRKNGISRTTYYKWADRYRRYGLEGLLHANRNSQQSANKTRVKNVITDYVMQYPNHGPARVSEHCMNHGISVSSVTVQTILNNDKLGTIKQRITKLEKEGINGNRKMTALMLNIIESYDPRFNDRDLITTGKTNIAQGVRYIGNTANGNRVYLHTAIELHSQYAFCSLHKGCTSWDAMFLIKNRVLPRFSASSQCLNSIITTKHKVYKERQIDQFYSLMKEKNIINQYDNTGLQIGSLQVFYKIIKRDFLASVDRQNIVIRQLLLLLEKWLSKYNDTAIYGFPNFGESPRNII